MLDTGENFSDFNLELVSREDHKIRVEGGIILVYWGHW